MPAAPQEDAALMAASQLIIPNSSSNNTTKRDKSSSSSSEPNNSATNALARSNLLRLETSELLQESFLHIHPPHANTKGEYESGSQDKSAHYEAKWAPNNNPLTSWSFPFQGGSTLTLHPIGSFAHIGNAGLSNRHANGNVLPMLDVAVLVNNDDSDGDGGGFVGGKDYLNHRYTDKRNILAVHIAKQLSQKKHRSKIGAVHLTNIFGDSRKVGLVLTPPLLDNVDNGGESLNNKKKKGKRKRGGGESKKKKDKLRFRIRLVFGVKQEQVNVPNNNSSHDNADSDEYSSSSDDEEEATSWNSWIPRSRFLPNRNNNRSSSTTTKQQHDGEHTNENSSSNILNSTPHYTNSLAEDIHLLSTSHLISSTLMTLTSTASTNPTSSFHETLLLLKVWALQRGFLRGHDGFTTTTLAILLVYLYRTKAIGKRMGCIQAFTTFMKFWSENDWLGEDSIDSKTSSAAAVREGKMKKKTAFVIPTKGKTESQTIAHCPQSRLYLDDSTNNNGPRTLLDCFKACYTSSSTSSSSSSSSIPNDSHIDSPILLDPTMTLNYLARLSPSFVRESRAEAYTALRYIHGHEQELGGGSGGGGEIGGNSVFHKLFLETNRFWTRYDAYVRVPLGAVPKIMMMNMIDNGGGGGGTSSGGGKKKHGKKNASAATSSAVWGQDVDNLGYDESVCRSVVEVLSRALGDRVTAIRAFTCGNGDITNNGGDADGGGEEDASKSIVDSDQCQTIPIRGTSSSSLFGYAARIGERPPMSPVAATPSSSSLVVGIRIDPNTSRRIVDRGPPAEDVEGSNAFVALWGEQQAQLRRFQDGAIVRAVVWNNAVQQPSPSASAAGSSSGRGDIVQFSGMDRSMGGIVERIVQHIVKLHFTDGKKVMKKQRKDAIMPNPVAFELRNMISFIDGVVAVAPSSSPSSSPFSDSLALHKNVMSAFDSLSDFLRRNTANTYETSVGKNKKVSKLGLPLSVDEVEPLSPCLRYSALFPPVPHPLLGGSASGDERKVSGANVGSPILIQIRFEGSSKWPTSLNAMGAAKCAMLVQLAEGIEQMKQEGGGGNDNAADLDSFGGPMDVTPNYLDIGYRGYSWRIIVRADQELRMLRSLRNPTQEAQALRLSLINRHIRGAMHHSLIHAVHTRHPSASSVVRLAHRWVASHMLSDMISTDAIELMVAKIYTETTTEKKSSNSKIGLIDTPPSTVVAGFLRFLRLLSTHDWAREPLIVDPQNHITSQDRGLIHAQFNAIRGPELKNGPSMYIVSPADYDGVEEMAGSKVVGENENTPPGVPADAMEKVWAPTITANFPEKVVLSRAAALAKCSHNHLTSCVMNGNVGNGWVAAFQESSASLTSYSALLRVDTSYITDPGCSSTNADCAIGATSSANENGPFEKSLQKRYAGPKELRKKHYKNLVLEKDTLHEWQPVKALVKALRSKYNDYAVFFYNEFAPDVIAMIWRPDAFKPQPFSAIVSEFKRPVAEIWKDDSLVITSTDDLMAEIGHFSRNLVSNFKVFDDKKPDDAPREKQPKKSRKTEDDESSESEEE
ncbi:hypothetical protein ACHAXR_013445 [Thalassiosira sp. AJA248-18]